MLLVKTLGPVGLAVAQVAESFSIVEVSGFSFGSDLHSMWQSHWAANQQPAQPSYRFIWVFIGFEGLPPADTELIYIDGNQRIRGHCLAAS